MPITPWRRFPSDPADWFSAEEIAKSQDYSGHSRRISRAMRGAGLAVEVLVVLTQLAPNLIEALEIRGWVLQLLVITLATALIDTVVNVPFLAYRELKFDKDWGFSKQTTGQFIGDTLKGLLIGVVVSAALAGVVWALIRTTDLWWVFGWLVMVAFVVIFNVLAPVIIQPLFNKFEPLSDDDLRDELLAMARTLDADVSEVLVSDASKRDTRQNAYVSGLGNTRRVVLFDTMLTRPRDQVTGVVAHELGHWKLAHIRRAIFFLTPLLLLLFAALRVVLSWDPLLNLAGVDSLREPAAVPLFWLVFGLLSRGMALLTAYESRVREREADLFALDGLQQPDAFVAAMRSLHTDNLLELTPSRWQRLQRTHPPGDERMAMGAEWARQQTARAAPTTHN